jgi:hypothetical protein
MLGQRVLQECWRSAQRWLASISNTMASTLSGKGGFELRGVVKPSVLQFRPNKRHDLYLIASLWVVATQARASLTLL